MSVVDAIRHAVAEFTDATALLAASHQTVKDRKHALMVRETYRLQAPLDVGVLLDEVDRLEGLLAQQGALATPGAP